MLENCTNWKTRAFQKRLEELLISQNGKGPWSIEELDDYFGSFVILPTPKMELWKSLILKKCLYMFFFCSLFWVFWVELLIKSVLTSKRHKWSSKADKHLFLSEILHNVPVKSASQLFEFMLKVPALTYMFENLKSLRGREKLIRLSTCLKWLSKEREFKSFFKKKYLIVSFTC